EFFTLPLLCQCNIKRTHSNPFTSQQNESRKLKIKCLADRSSQHQNRSIYLRYVLFLYCVTSYPTARRVLVGLIRLAQIVEWVLAELGRRRIRFNLSVDF